MVKSHIQMPRCILKRFEKNEKFYYYDVEKKIIGKNGHAKSLNTQYGYYSPDFEEFLSNNIESPIGELLKALDEFDFEQPNFGLSNEFELRTRRLFYSLISRSPSFHNEINNRSDFFRLLNEQDQHDLVVYNGIKIAIEKKLLEEFAVTLTINKTRIGK